jgi:hypothetical protein
MSWRRRWWRRDERVDVESDSQGAVTFNHLQQSEPEADFLACEPPVVTTDPWGITDPDSAVTE